VCTAKNPETESNKKDTLRFFRVDTTERKSFIEVKPGPHGAEYSRELQILDGDDLFAED